VELRLGAPADGVLMQKPLRSLDFEKTEVKMIGTIGRI
jgi:hypothetical protein